MSNLLLTVIQTKINVRRAPSATTGSILQEARAGQQFAVMQVIDIPGSLEQWAKIVIPDRQDEAAYVCVRLANGKRNCDVSAVANQSANSDEYLRGRKDELDRMIGYFAAERAKMGP